MKDLEKENKSEVVLSDKEWYDWKEVCGFIVEDALFNKLNVNDTIKKLSKKFKLTPKS